MFHVDTTSKFVVSEDLIRILIVIFVLVAIYFFSRQIIATISKIGTAISKKIGTFSASREYYLTRYVYQHTNSPISKLYNWLNEQIIALGLKRQGVTPFGYFLFWAVIAIIAGIVLSLILKMGIYMTPLFCIVILVVELIMTRVVVSNRMQKREADIMDAIDLIVPEIKNGVKNSIIVYQDNFKPSVIDDFKAFIVNITNRGYSFEDAMILLADSLGLVFTDFAQKAIYYEALGDPNMVDIFTDIVETNRFRRQLRDENESKFMGLTVNFLMSAGIVAVYFVFLMITDDFSRTFFLTNFWGKMLLMVIILVIFGVLAFITTIKSTKI